MSSRMDASRDRIDELINKAKEHITPKGIPILNYISNSYDFTSQCGNAAMDGSRVFSYEDFLNNLRGGKNSNFAQEELARAFEERRNVFSESEKHELYEFLVENSNANPSANYRMVSSEASRPKPTKSVKPSVKPKKPKKPKGGSRKTRRSKSNRRRNKTYRR
jgi:hypothetical protein